MTIDSNNNDQPLIRVRGVSKRFGKFLALDQVDLDVPAGAVLGVIGANGAGKTTLLNAILGLAKYDGQISVLGKDPIRDRDALMEDVCFIADVATLPRWMKVRDVIDYVGSVHPKFDATTCLKHLEKTDIPLTRKVRALSKGMVTQLHLALVMSIDAKILVLDEPTLGLDIIYRKDFYRRLIGDYYDGNRTILITTHQVDEIEHILTHALFVSHGRVALHAPMDEIGDRFTQLVTDAHSRDAARALKPLHEHESLGKSVFVYEGADRACLAGLGELRQPTLSDLFVAVMTGDKK